MISANLFPPCLPFRQRKCAMFHFRQMLSLQKFAAVHSSVFNHFNQERSLYFPILRVRATGFQPVCFS